MNKMSKEKTMGETIDLLTTCKVCGRDHPILYGVKYLGEFMEVCVDCYEKIRDKVELG